LVSPHLSSGVLAPYDLSFVVEVESDRRHVEVRADPLSNSVLVPALVLAAGGVEPEDDQVSIKVK